MGLGICTQGLASKAIVKVVWVLEDGLIKQFVMGIAVGVMKHLWLVVGFLR